MCSIRQMLSDLLAAFAASLPSSPAFYAVGLLTIFATAVSKGAFGGGLPIIVPMLALVVDPIGAALIAAPLLVLMDGLALRSFGLGNASWPDLRALLPGLLIGLGLGWAMFELVDHRIVTLAIAIVTLLFAVHWFARTRVNPVLEGEGMAPSAGFGLLAGSLSGFSTFIAHAGGPPIMIYLLRRGLNKSLLAGTMVMFFLIANVIKLLPFGFLMADRPQTIAQSLILAPAIPLGIVLGKWIHDSLNQRTIYFWCHVLLLLTGAKMLFDALRAFA
jgi:uncharacterized protein